MKSLRKSYTRQVKEAAKRAAEEAANWEQSTSQKLLALEHAGKGDSPEAHLLLRERELRNLPVAFQRSSVLTVQLRWYGSRSYPNWYEVCVSSIT